MMTMKRGASWTSPAKGGTWSEPIKRGGTWSGPAKRGSAWN